MNISLVAFRVAHTRVGEVLAKHIVNGPTGVRGLKTTVVDGAIGASLRNSLDQDLLWVSGREFHEAKDFIFNYFPGTLHAQVTRVPRGEVRADCELSIFVAKDLIFLGGGLLNTNIPLSIELQIRLTFWEAIDQYMSYHRGDLNTLVVAVNCVYDAVEITSRELGKYLGLLRRGEGLRGPN